jgi:hypothetical protein
MYIHRCLQKLEKLGKCQYTPVMNGLYRSECINDSQSTGRTAKRCCHGGAPFLYHQLISSFILGKDPFTLWSFVTVCYWKWHYLSSLIYLVIIHSYLSFTMFYLLIRLVWWWFSIIVQFANCHQPRPEAPQLATAADERPRLREPGRCGRVPGAARVPWRNAMAPPGCT